MSDACPEIIEIPRTCRSSSNIGIVDIMTVAICSRSGGGNGGINTTVVVVVVVFFFFLVEVVYFED